MSEILKDDLREIKDYTVYSRQTVFPFDVFGETGKGGRAENQDSFWFGDTSYGLLLIVCDGMGGGPGGRTASTLAVQEIGNYVNNHPNLKPRDVVIGSVLHANKALYNYSRQHAELMGMGSTCVVALFSEDKVIVCHVGDSRFYQYRKHQEIFHTCDHSQVFEMVKNGILNEEEARVSFFSNVITKGLGLSLDLKIEIQPDTSSDILEMPYRKGDRFVLCSDGIHGVLPANVLTRELNESGALEIVTNDVVSKIHQLGVNSGNQHDNLTLLMISAKVNSKMPEAQRPPRFVAPKKLGSYNWKKLLLAIIPIVILFVAFVIWRGNSIDTDVNETIEIDSVQVDISESKTDVKESPIIDEDKKNFDEIEKKSEQSKPSQGEERKHQKGKQLINKEEKKDLEIKEAPKNQQTDGTNSNKEPQKEKIKKDPFVL